MTPSHSSQNVYAKMFNGNPPQALRRVSQTHPWSAQLWSGGELWVPLLPWVLFSPETRVTSCGTLDQVRKDNQALRSTRAPESWPGVHFSSSPASLHACSWDQKLGQLNFTTTEAPGELALPSQSPEDQIMVSSLWPCLLWRPTLWERLSLHSHRVPHL